MEDATALRSCSNLMRDASIMSHSACAPTSHCCLLRSSFTSEFISHNAQEFAFEAVAFTLWFLPEFGTSETSSVCPRSATRNQIRSNGLACQNCFSQLACSLSIMPRTHKLSIIHTVYCLEKPIMKMEV